MSAFDVELRRLVEEWLAKGDSTTSIIRVLTQQAAALVEQATALMEHESNAAEKG